MQARADSEALSNLLVENEESSRVVLTSKSYVVIRMATFDDNWQTKRPTISKRTKYIFNNELLSDVKFVVPASLNESESRKGQKSIPAHKFVLAISSPVFFAMFYGEMAETAGTVQLPDCDYESLLELFRYLYSDDVKLSGSNVMQVLYLAKKYMVPSLADKCTKYLLKHLEASNVFSILPQAQKYEEKDLENQCWGVIEKHTQKALMSDEFLTLERSVVESVVKRDGLKVKEVDLFKAVDRWATKELERQGKTRSRKIKRKILGEEIVKAIRFSLISQKEFASVVLDCDILSKTEICDMIRYYNEVDLKSSLAFMHCPRTMHRCYRFAEIKRPLRSSFYYNRNDALNLTVNKPVRLHGVQHFGSDGDVYFVSLELKDERSGLSLAQQSGSYFSEIDDTRIFYGFDVRFDNPVCLETDRTYEITSHIEGPSFWYGESGTALVGSQEVLFLFSNSAAFSDGTSVTRGQFPAFLFSTM